MYELILIFIQILIILCMIGHKRFFYTKHWYVLIVFLLLTIISLFFYTNIILALCLYTIYYLIALLFSYTRLKSIFLVSFFFLIQNSLMTFIWVMPNLFFISLENNSSSLYFVQILALSILIYFLKIIDGHYKLWTLVQKYSDHWTSLGFFIFFTSNFLLGYRQYTISIEKSISNYIYSSLFLLGYSIIFTLFSFLIVKVLANKKYIEQLIDKSQENKKYTKLANEFQHDFKTFLYTTKRYTQLEDLEGLKQYLETLEKYSVGLLNHSLLNQVQNIKDPAIQGLLINCIEQCSSNNIKLTLEIEDLTHHDFFYTIDFTRCLSILINNAIEHSSNKIYIRFYNVKDMSYCTIRNTSETPIKIDEIFKRNFSTKKGHRGLGLAILKNIIQNYKYTELIVENINNWVSFTIASTK